MKSIFFILLLLLISITTVTSSKQSVKRIIRSNNLVSGNWTENGVLLYGTNKHYDMVGDMYECNSPDECLQTMCEIYQYPDVAYVITIPFELPVCN